MAIPSVRGVKSNIINQELKLLQYVKSADQQIKAVEEGAVLPGHVTSGQWSGARKTEPAPAVPSCHGRFT